MENCPGSINLITEAIVDSLPTGVVAFDRDLKIVYVNSTAKVLLRNGDRLDKCLCAATSSSVWGDWQTPLRAVISESSTASFDSVEFAHSGGIKLLKITCCPLKGESPGAIAMLEDITDRDKPGRDLSHAERLAAVGKVAGKVAHELNNPMDGILRYINMSQRAIENGQLDKPREYLPKCKDGLMRMVGIISQLLEFSRGKYLNFEYAPLDKIVEESVKAVSGRSGKVEIKINRPQRIDGTFRADNLYQVFSNIIKNAIDAMNGEGELEIMICTKGDEVAVEFKDSGPGFDEKHARMIFEPFFTTKENGKGTGLGLAICKDMIEKLEGRITAENNEDKGCKFTVYLKKKQVTGNRVGFGPGTSQG